MATIGQSLPLPESGWKRIDDNDPKILYLGSGWVSEKVLGDNYGGSIHYTQTVKGTKIRFKFRGTKLRYIGISYATHSTEMVITIDGISETFTQRRSTTVSMCLEYEKTGLSYGEHVVDVYSNNSYGPRLDAIDIDEDGALLEAPQFMVGDQLTAPEPGWKRYDDDHPTIDYSKSNLTYFKGTPYYSSTVHYSNIGSGWGNVEGIIKFSFYGTSLRLIGGSYSTPLGSHTVIIDGNEETVFKLPANTHNAQYLFYSKEGLTLGQHEVIINIKNDGQFGLDAIDIDSNGHLLHPDEVTDIKDLDVGKRIRCHYQASSGNVGVFSGLGQETSDFIPVASTATPNGDFYFIMVENWNKKRILVADRNIQHSISWDNLNNVGIASGSGLLEHFFLGDNLFVGGNAYSNSVWNGHVPENAFGSAVNGYQDWTSLSSPQANRYYLEYQKQDNMELDILEFRQGSGGSEVSSIEIQVYRDGKWSLLGYYKVNAGLNFIRLNGVKASGIRFYANSALANTSYGWSIVEVRAYQFIRSDKYSFTTRLLTGGVSSVDKDNEWDKHIINSTLNGTITAGDNNFWNASLWSWTSTTSSAATHRTIRGGGSASGWNAGNPGSHYVGTNVGFRPVLEIESLTTHFSFILSGGEYKKYSPQDASWKTISTTLPNANTFNIEGMEDLSVLDRKLKTINIQMDDNTSSGEVLGEGRVFEERVDLKKYSEITSIKVK